ncbi:DNA replication initiation control protein YabA [Acetilactobacillus jinshanensis]|uniref:DNA replication initiation control protein YabA n=1 Tax=Acetilactobacillus jinshanensis TaxID=1720083 RepID=A0A4P6ZNS4_9LACO|nr:DNA replication initiation control protein YabA [Acetilactobacillus jinshanensis]QBP18830.1 DNA replication initiation control protein YabA [Acetilactobacillus jinshanensis]
MDDRQLYEGFKSMEAQTQLMLTKFSELREGVTRILEENSELKIENQHLRAVLGKKHRAVEKKTPKKGPQLTKSRQNLLKLYNQGFHVCNQFFGKHRDKNENCLFCNKILFWNSSDDHDKRTQK